MPARRRELRRRLGRLVEGVAERVGGGGDRGERRLAVGALDPGGAVAELDVVLARLEHVGGGVDDLLADEERRLVDGVAGDDGGAAREGGDAPVEGAGVALDQDHVLDGDAELVGDDLAEHGLVALPLRGQAGVDVDLAGDRVDLDVPALVGAEAGALDVEGEAEAEVLALGPRLLLLGGEVGRRELVRHHRQRLLVLAAVEADAEAVGEEQALARPRELVVADEVAAAHLEAVEAELLGELVHRPLDGEAGLRPAAAAIGRHRHGRRVDGGELDPDVGDAIRPGDRGRGDLRDRDAVGDEGAGVVEEAVAERDHLAGLLGVELDRSGSASAPGSSR